MTPRRRARLRAYGTAYLFLTPMILGLLFFSLGPVVAALLISLTKWDIVNRPEWIGLGNYVTMVNQPLTWTVFSNTLYYTILTVPGGIAVSLAAALVLNQKIRWTTFYRAVYFLPVITSGVAVAYIWGWLYNPSFGLLNYLLAKIGIAGPLWLGSTRWAMPAIAIMSIWRGFGYNMVIFLAGLQGIPEELYEAAEIDGANRWHCFRHVTWPMLTPTTFLVLVLTTVSSFQVFEQTYILTRGGPAWSTLTIALHIYFNAFQYFRMGFAAALAYVLFAVILVVTVIQFATQHRWTFYQ